MEYTVIIELAVWLVMALVAKQVNSDYMFRACDIYLIFVLSGHRWMVAIPAFVLLLFFIRICNGLSEIIQQALIPELKDIIHMKAYDYRK